MRYDIIIPLLIYQVLSIFGVGLYLAKTRNKDEDGGFTLGGRSFGLLLLVPTLVLVMLGTGHTIGGLEATFSYGAVQVWFVLGHVAILSLGLVTTCLWARRMRGTTISELLGRIYGDEMKILIAAVNATFTWAIISIETQGMAIILNVITGFDLRWGIVIGGVLGLAYSMLAGLKQSAILNMINIVVLYAGLGISVFYIALSLPGQNFDSIQAHYLASEPGMLSFWGFDGSFFAYAIPAVIAPLFCHSAGQLLLQPAMAAKSERVIRKAIWFCGPINCLVGIFIVTIGLTAKAMPEFSQMPGKLYAWQYMISLLPPWVMVLLLSSMFAAVLSSFSGCALGPATVFVEDFIKPYFKPDINQRQYDHMVRIVLVVITILAVAIAAYLPPVISALNWLFAWAIPAYFLFAIGLYWKITKRWALFSLLFTWGVNCLWTFTPLASWLGLPKFHEAYVVSVVSLVLLLIGNLCLKGETAYFRSDAYLKSKEFRQYRDELNNDISYRKIDRANEELSPNGVQTQ